MLREFTTIKSVLQEMLQEDFSGCRKVMVQKLSSAEWNEVHWRLWLWCGGGEAPEEQSLGCELSGWVKDNIQDKKKTVSKTGQEK